MSLKVVRTWKRDKSFNVMPIHVAVDNLKTYGVGEVRKMARWDIDTALRLGQTLETEHAVFRLAGVGISSA